MTEYKERPLKNNYELYEAEIKQLYLEGATIQEIAFLFDVEPSNVSVYLKSFDQVDNHMYEKILLLKRRGLDISEISMILDIGPDEVSSYCSNCKESKKKSKIYSSNINYFRDILLCLRIIRDSALYPRVYDTMTVITSLANKGLTGTEIGEVLGMTKQSVSKYINNISVDKE